MRILKKMIITSILSMFFLLSLCAKAKASNTTKILFIGNSSTYYNDMPLMVKGLGTASGKQIDVETITCPNYTLTNFSTDSNTYFKLIKSTLQTEKFDYVILQDHRENVIQKLANSEKAINKLLSYIKTNEAKPILYATQSDLNNHSFNINSSKILLDHNMIDQYLSRNYSYMGNKLDINVALSGINFTRCMNIFPEINLYNSDEIHPSLEGSYLAACTLYARIFSITPLGNGYIPGSSYDSTNILKKMTVENALKLQKIADASLSFTTKNIDVKKGTTSKAEAHLSYSNTNDSLDNYTNKINYFSSDNNILAVNKNSGNFTGISTGSALIGAETDSGLVTYLNVNIISPATSLSVTSKSTIKKTKGSTYTYKTSMKPSDCTDSIHWTSSNNKIASVNNKGKVTALKLGTVKITAITDSGIKVKRNFRVILVAPKNLKVKKSKLTSTKKGNIKISWKKNSNASKYYIFRKVKHGSYKKIAVTTKSHYYDKNKTVGVKYYYKVKSIHTNTLLNSSRTKSVSITLK